MQCPQTRRIFMLRTLALSSATTAAAVGTAALAQDAPKPALTESDPYAKSMGFRLDTTKVDKARYPRHTVEQNCKTCQLFSGKEGEPLGPCSFYGGRLVPPQGWCRNFKVRKPGAAA
jgi:hypothetical protein